MCSTSIAGGTRPWSGRPEDRTHRLGQTVKVNVVKYACADTIEERIDQVLERKQALFDSLVDDVSLDLSARMNREELLGLFGLR